MARKGLMEGLPENLPEFEEPCPICLLIKATKPPEVQPLMSQNLPLGSCFKSFLYFSMLKVSVDLPQLLWVYALLLHIRLDSHTEARVHLLTS